MKIAYYELSITPHHAGFGMYDRGEDNCSREHAWANLPDLEAEMMSNAEDLLPLDEARTNDAFLAAGITNIRGRIYGGDPTYLYAYLSDGELAYTGVDSVEVPEDFWKS